jgi:hypothetical protein
MIKVIPEVKANQTNKPSESAGKNHPLKSRLSDAFALMGSQIFVS